MYFRTFSLLLAGLLWLAAVAVGLGALWSFSDRPGEAVLAPTDWPTDASISLDGRRPTLLVLLHPHCPCSRATVAELSRLMTECRGMLSAHVLLVKPPGTSDGWEKTGLVSAVAHIPGVQVHLDEGGRQAARFASATSGQALLYDVSGRLLFQGGITKSRGEQGDNAGRAAIAALVRRGHSDMAQTPVFGCPLFTPSSVCFAQGSDSCR